jgi:hypothetical protein
MKNVISTILGLLLIVMALFSCSDDCDPQPVAPVQINVSYKVSASVPVVGGNYLVTTINDANREVSPFEGGRSAYNEVTTIIGDRVTISIDPAGMQAVMTYTVAIQQDGGKVEYHFNQVLPFTYYVK